MTSEVTEYLRTAATPEYCAIAEETLKLFQDFEFTEPEQDLLNTVMAPSVSEETTVVQDIHFTLVDNCRELLSMHHITLVDDVSLELMNTVLRGLYQMQAWEDKVTLQRLLEQDSSPEEIFADVLNEVTGADATQIIDALVDFDNAVNKRLAEILEGSLPESAIEEDEVDEQQIIRLKNYNTFLNNNKLIGIRLVRLGYRVGAPFENYYRKVKHHLDVLEPSEFAQEIIVLLLLGRDTWTSPSQSFNDKKVMFDLELDVAAKIDLHIREQWAKFQSFIPS